MSIVKRVKDETPKEGQIVYCDNGQYSEDRAIFKNGEFIGGGDFPISPYKMNHVTKWFCLSDYDSHFKAKGQTSYGISFGIASEIILK